jgi:RNA polymerase sigma-70 factor (TIGR02960 family)
MSPGAAGRSTVMTSMTAAAGNDTMAHVGDDERRFAELAQRHRRELHVHCYRMLGSFDEAEDLVQETLMRAWDRRATFSGGSGMRAWLYKIATNACLDALRRRKRQAQVLGSPAEVPWLQPYPDQLLDEAAPRDDEPDAQVVARESIELAFLVTVQVLPPQQRAVLLLRDVLGWSAAETAAAMETTVAAANSVLQRARVTMREHLPQRRLDWTAAEPSAEERAVLERFIDSHNRADVAAAVDLMRHDIRITMPPYPMCFDGRDAIAPLLERAFGGEHKGEWRLVPTAANRQPAAISYYREPGETEFRIFKIDVLRVVEGRVAEVTTFGPAQWVASGTPEVLAG